MPETLTSTQLLRRLAHIGLAVAALVLLVATLPGLADVRERMAGAGPGWVALALVLELASVASFVVAFRGVFCARLPWGFSTQVGLSEQAANVLLPSGGAGGLALGAWALRRAGMPADHIARRTVAFFLITSSANFVTAVLAGGATLAGLLHGRASLTLTAGPAALALVTMAVVLALPRALPTRPSPERAGESRLRRWARTGGATVAGGVRDAVALVGSGRPAVIGGAAGYLAFDIAALAAAFHAFGASPATGDFLLAYVIGQLGGLVPLPGGVGGTDGGLVAALALYGTPLASATAAVLAYRGFQLGVPAIAGSVAFARLRHTLRDDDRMPLLAQRASRPARSPWTAASTRGTSPSRPAPPVSSARCAG